jgi:hypothetical protein
VAISVAGGRLARGKAETQIHPHPRVGGADGEVTALVHGQRDEPADEDKTV